MGLGQQPLGLETKFFNFLPFVSKKYLIKPDQNIVGSKTDRVLNNCRLKVYSGWVVSCQGTSLNWVRRLYESEGNTV